MNISNIETQSTWRDVANNARVTIGLENKEGRVSDSWINKIIKAEHSPIRQRVYIWTWYDIPYWVSVHLVRHKIGIEHFVKTSRSDKTGVDRNHLPQNSPVNHKCIANVQALINISRKRLCNQASHETQKAWQIVRENIEDIDPIMAHNMVPECIYRGFCPEFKSCGFVDSEKYTNDREKYLNDY